MSLQEPISQTAPAQRTMTGAEIVVQALIDQGVDTLFGYPGGAVLPIYDALFQDGEKHGDRLKHILVRHEQGASHAAEGYARSTGRPGVVLVTSGPGATNAVTGIVDARSATFFTRKLCLTIGRVMPTVSHSWKASVPIRWVATWPVMTTSGMESIRASTMPVMALVAPGPEVTRTTPGLPVERA